jgi:hypothetical protein
MKTFKDNANRTWTLSLSISALKRVKALTGVDLMAALNAEGGGKSPLIHQLCTDPVLVCDVLFAALKTDADRLGVTDEAFGESLSGEYIAAAHTALLEELHGFFLALGRREVAAAIEKYRQTVGLAADEGARDIERIDPSEILRKSRGLPSGSVPAS